ncbi:MAG TPA: UDP-2,3-diacylglucosamine diphosphatase LpxI [Candidatus Methylacidiphilales bacterium]|nr:UDP-2,3-diacylglucosamine diphosphatase LpxI [Candidatus Methylacidiphilales bacterium]
MSFFSFSRKPDEKPAEFGKVLSAEERGVLDLGIIAGSGRYPVLLAEAARKAGVKRIVVAAFKDETDPVMEELADICMWMRVGQLGRMISFFGQCGAKGAIMAGQIAPSNLFNLRPDMKALLLLAKLKERNAESIFGAIGAEMSKAGTELLPATSFLEDAMPGPGLVAGPALPRRSKMDIQYGYRIAKEVSRLDIGQSVVVKKGTVLAVEAFEGTDATIARGGQQSRGEGAVLVKVSKPKQDMRFDVPVIGPRTMESARASGISVVACEANRTLLLDKAEISRLAVLHKITVYAAGEEMLAEDAAAPGGA